MDYWTFHLPLFHAALILLAPPALWLARHARRRAAERRQSRRGFEPLVVPAPSRST